MRFRKKVLDNLERCYCVNKILIDDQLHLLFAEEEIGGRCYEYYGDDFSNKRLVWDNGGGTMAIVPIPNKNGEFLAIQRFFPGLNAKEAKIVWCKLVNDSWITYDYLAIPYLHRFDLIEFDNTIYLVGSIVSKHKDSRDDWSVPGCVMYAKLTEDYDIKPVLNEIDCDIYKNHGYTRNIYKNEESYFFSGDNGIFKLKFEDNRFELDKFTDLSISDVCFIDIDNDDHEEMLSIEPFHGDNVKIYKEINSSWQKQYEYPKEIAFAHAISSGYINDMPCFVFGVRRKNMELVLITYDHKLNEYVESVIDQNCGSANVLIFRHQGQNIIASCNHTINEAALYYIEK